MSETLRDLDSQSATTPPEEGPTYYGRPAIKEPVWIWAVPAYLFTGGVGAGAATVAGVAQLVDRDGLDWLVTRGRWVAVGTGMLSTALLIHDLGRPARFLNMLRVFRPSSAMSMGSWTLASFAAASTASTAAPLVFRNRFGRALGNLGGVGAMLLGPVLGTYTGVLLGDTVVPIWSHTRKELPLLFGASAVAGTADVLDLLGPDEASRTVTRRLATAGKSVEMGLAERFQHVADEHPEVGRPLHEGVSGDLWKASKVLTGASLAASALPLPRALQGIRRVVSAVLGVVGALTMRFAIVKAGTASARDPQATFAPQRRRRGGAG